MKTTLIVLLVVWMLLPLTAYAISAEDFVVSDDVDDTDKYYFYARLLMADMTPEEKVAQLFITNPEQLTQNAEAVSVTEDMQNRIRECAPGGVMILGQNIVSGEQLNAMCNAMQNASSLGRGIPLFIAAEEEGGYVERIAMKLGLEDTPSLAQLANTGYEEDAYFHGQTLALRLKEYGINLNFAPVGDVRSNESESFVKERYAGNDAQLTAMITTQIAKGMQDEGILPVMKHFPGESGGEDIITASYAEMMQNMLPFRQAVENEIGMIMVSSIPVQALDAGVPAMFSAVVCDGLLREELGFEGVVVTDKLCSPSIKAQFATGDAAVRAIEAGCDMLLLPEDYQMACSAILKAVDSGLITQERIDQSVVRILALKIISGMID